MDNLKFVLFSIFVLALLGLAGYWAFSTLETGTDHVYNEEIDNLKTANEELEKQVASLTRENELLKSDSESNESESTNNSESNSDASSSSTTSSATTTTATTTTTYKYQTLIDDLQKLVDKNAYLKLKSQGTSVGTVQKFLNIYGSSIKADNDYGAGTVTAVKAFQKAQGLTADGEVGVNTLKKMITWLKSKN